MSKLRDRIIASAERPRTEVVTIRSLGNERVEIRALSGTKVFEIRAASVDPDTKEIDDSQFPIALMIAALRDPETHEPLFTAGDRDALLELEYGVLNEMATHTMRICGIGGTKTEEELLKNSSSGTPSSAPPSTSPSVSAG